MILPDMTTTTRTVLTQFLDDPDAELYGRQIARTLQLHPGTVQPILKRFHTRGWLTLRKETDLLGEGRGHRHFYSLTSTGWEAARNAAQTRPTP